MRIITRTVYGAYLQTSKLLNLPFEMITNTTLNEKLGIQAGIEPQQGAMPYVQYFTIGNGGHRNVTGADGVPYTTPIQHRSSDAALFNHLPFVLRQPNNDLSPAERAKYALRREETHGGLTYYAYYLRRLDLSAVDNVMNRTTVVDGASNTLPFSPSNSNLNPEKPETNPSEVEESTGDYLSTSAIVTVNFDEDDVAELIHVAEVIYNNELLAVISEIGLCSGVDKTVTYSVPGGDFNFNEAIAVQINSHITSFYSMAFNNNGFQFQVEMGATEPLLGENGGS